MPPDSPARTREPRATTREQAIERLAKLRAITVERGATPHEARAARARADALAARLGLDGPTAGRRIAGYAAGAAVDRRAPRSLRFVAFA